MKALIPLARALAAAALVLGAGCGSNCRKACEHVAALCSADGGELPNFNVDQCTSDCEGNVNACRNLDTQVNCFVNAQVCEDLQSCPACME